MEIQKGICFQVISRNNDVNGNPYRLVLIYGKGEFGPFDVVDVIEARSSSPNIVNELHRLMTSLPSFHVSPAEYNTIRKAFYNLLRYSN